jgi:O-antigen ligase
LLLAFAQLVPVSPALRYALSPALRDAERALRLDADAAAATLAPLNLDPAAGLQSVVLAAAIVLLFWCARAIFEEGAVRRTARTIAAFGLALGAIAIAQHATAPHSLYWIWKPESRSAESPFGPFVNRNDLAAWLVMALPLAAGYLASRIETRRRHGRLDADSIFDSTGVWLSASVCVMAAALVTSLSRSGITAAICAVASLVTLSRGRVTRGGRTWLLVAISLVALIAAGYANMGALTARVGETVESGVGGRREIWQATAAIVADYWRTGVGVGAFERAMSLYQPPHLFAFNHAHDEYLQLAAEGGLLLGVPMAIAIIAGAAAIAARLRADRTPLFWLRAGAASALVAIGVQSIWETGLRMPANAVLFAVCSAIAVHRPRGEKRG